MNTLLTVPDIVYLLTQQEKLDSDIREKKGIDIITWNHHLDNQHEIALMVEKHEFINECHDVWKYWKSKPVNMEKILDEAVDVIHFFMLLKNKSVAVSMTTKAEAVYDELVNCSNFYKYQGMDNPLTTIFELLDSENNSYVEQLYVVLCILDHYGFSAQDILDAYNRKNKVNFERLESGY